MGGQTSITYCAPVTEKPQGETAIYRCPSTREKLWDRPSQQLDTMKAVIINCYKEHGNKSALGKIIKKDDKLAIQYLTYKQVVEHAHQIGSGIIKEKLFSVPQGEEIKLIGLFSKNRLEWGLTDIACLLFNIATIPIYDTLGDQNITYVLQHTQLGTAFVNNESLKSLSKCKDIVNLKNIVCFDPFTEEQEAQFKERGAVLIPFTKVQQEGKGNLLNFNDEEYKTSPEDCLTFSYTSGTTGPPKGAMVSHKNFTSFLGAEVANNSTLITSDDVALSYLPLPHILERSFDYAFMHKGAKIVYFQGDMKKLKEDLALVKPTVFLSVPRLFSRFYEVLKKKISQVQGFTKTALDYALKTKFQNLKKSGAYKHAIYDRIFFAKTREALGGRCRLMISGSAPLLPEVQAFLKVVLCAPLVQGYGQTESTGAMLFTASDDPGVKRVGGPVANFEIKLVDLPDMEYLSTDKDQEGRLAPRGEIWARGPGVFMGYYHDEKKTKEAITQDGWLKTGDIGEMSAETKSIGIIDRMKNIFKLQQGEYVAAEKVQNIYKKCPLLAEVFIHGESTETFAIAIVVPDRKELEKLAQSKGIEGEFEDLCQNDDMRKQIVAQLSKFGKEAGLQSFEQAKNIYAESESFQTKGIMSNTMKVQRHEAKKMYKEIIDKLYEEGMLTGEKEKK